MRRAEKRALEVLAHFGWAWPTMFDSRVSGPFAAVNVADAKALVARELAMWETGGGDGRPKLLITLAGREAARR